MTRLAPPLTPPPRPHSIVLGELAIAAGIAGQPITLLYRDFPAPVLCEIWRHHARGLAADQVLQVRSQADVRSLDGRIDDVRMVLVHAGRLRSAVVWAIQMAPAADGEIISRPAVFATAPLSDLNEEPGATLVLNANAGELAAITRWSILAEHDGPDWATIQSPTGIRMNPVLVPVVPLDSSPAGCGLRRVRDRRVLQGLLIGAGLLRSSRQVPAAGLSVGVTLQDYESVRRLLQSRTVCPADVPVDRLAVDMVNRANVYLEVKYGPPSADGNAFPRDQYYDYRDSIFERPGRPLVTRREIADLGNIRSGTVRRLIGYLQRRDDGYDLFGRMGLARRRPGLNDFASIPATQLASLLRSWSVKQMRTRFEQLHKVGLITAERQPASGVWCYTIPEEFSGSVNPFRNLPPANQLTSPTPVHPAEAAS